MLDPPIYLRPEDYSYRLQPDPSHPLVTGVGPAGRQVLAFPGAVLEFDADGRLTGDRDGGPDAALPPGFREEPIAVRRFWIPGRRLGVTDVPVGLLGLPRDPALFAEEDWEYVRTSDWFEGGHYALCCGCASAGLNQLFVARDGECLIHSV